MASVAVIGAGAVGSYYGARLAQAGHDVRFLLRRDYDAVAERGLRIESHHGDFLLERPAIARDPAEIGPVDWVLCGLKTTSLDAAPDLIRPCLGPETRVLAIMNGLGIEERLAEALGTERIFGGLAFTCINRGEPGTIHHYEYGQVSIAHLRDDPAELERALALWEDATVEVSAAPSIIRARWEKLCWNVPFNGLTVAAGGVTTEAIVTDPTRRAEARALMEEVVAAGNADLEARNRAERIDGDEVITRMFTLTDVMGPYRPSTLIDFVEGRAIEVDAIFAEPARRARTLGVPTPRLDQLAALLAALDPARG
ncbi:MAG: 2-dehydropantoate 2-reductase [Chloroflexi bacterium]|nr:2-dehydropantoate 2-reductase [Chloroflexota bacterium]